MKRSDANIAPVNMIALVVLLCGSAQAQDSSTRHELSVDALTRKAVVEEIARIVEDRYVYKDIGARTATDLRSRLAHGEYDSVADARAFAKLLTEHLRAVS